MADRPAGKDIVMVNFILVVIIVIAVVAALAYIIKAKKSGQKCIGCPHAGTCGKDSGSDNCCG